MIANDPELAFKVKKCKLPAIRIIYTKSADVE